MRRTQNILDWQREGDARAVGDRVELRRGSIRSPRMEAPRSVLVRGAPVEIEIYDAATDELLCRGATNGRGVRGCGPGIPDEYADREVYVRVRRRAEVTERSGESPEVAVVERETEPRDRPSTPIGGGDRGGRQ